MFYIFYIYIFIFHSVEKFFSVKKIFVIKLFFHIKMFFSANNVYFVKNKYFFKEKKIFFELSFATNEQPQATASKQGTVPLQCLHTAKSLISFCRRTGETILSNYWQNPKITVTVQYFHYNSHHDYYHYYHFHYHCQMHLYRLKILLNIFLIKLQACRFIEKRL